MKEYKCCFVTALFYKDNKTDLPPPIKKFNNYDFIIFSNREISVEGYEVIVLSDNSIP